MKNNNIVRTIAEVGIFAAIGFILDEIQGALAFSFTSGGSIGIAMVAVLIIAYRRGWLPAIATGLIMGLLDIATKAYVVHWAQIFLDYILPYALVGVAGFFKPLFDKAENNKAKLTWLIVGTVIGGVLKFFSHYFAGLFFWNVQEYFAWNLSYMNPALYSFVYNIAYIGPCIILSVVFLVILYLRAPKIFEVREEVEKENKKTGISERAVNITISITLFSVGITLFTIFFIKYLASHYYESYDWVYGHELDFYFDADSMVIFMLGIGLMLLGINHIISTLKNKQNNAILLLIIGLLMFVVSGYGLARILDMYIDKDEVINNNYWTWFSPTLLIGIQLIILYKYLDNKKKAISAN